MKEFQSVFYRLICFQALIVLSCVLPAQNIPADSPEEILKQRQEVFSQIKALEDPLEDSLWYQGRIYDFVLRSKTGTPYFQNIQTLTGSLTYNGKLHKDLILSYNLVLDELIILKKTDRVNMMQLVLNKYYVERFSLKYSDNYYHFRMHSEMKPIHDQLKEGFYEEIYDDEVRMFVKHKKQLYFNDTNFDPFSYQYESQVYLIVDGKIYDVDNRRDYLKAFQDYKKSLRKYMKQASINFEKSGTQALFSLCAYSKSLLENQDTGIERN